LSNFALALKNRVWPEFFHCIEIFFSIHNFWATCACPQIFHCIEIAFYHSGFLSKLRLPWKFSSRRCCRPLRLIPYAQDPVI